MKISKHPNVVFIFTHLSPLYIPEFGVSEAYSIRQSMDQTCNRRNRSDEFDIQYVS
jgi:hypothetical protein